MPSCNEEIDHLQKLLKLEMKCNDVMKKALERISSNLSSQNTSTSHGPQRGPNLMIAQNAIMQVDRQRFEFTRTHPNPCYIGKVG